jgi:hypothetical protein
MSPPPRPKRPSKNAVAAAIRTLEAAKQYLTDEELDELLAPIIDEMPLSNDRSNENDVGSPETM